ncbi:MAG: hypothetical protein A2Z11_03545 [Candidatus Woykebacteria bacterium RBG_16_43_9]|uniref:SHS2 domain-containing protein n=1 Tax=Candidatus Woykebacteria bacterium RBG_16_43_9 TaxID=1802596 RepID=A0A1G1WCQ5_9BACT|nr:MAG: hypothetical protein A2Z11_03545 [Candidatus Woykebacteria bacterium RBG_16_43_9]
MPSLNFFKKKPKKKDFLVIEIGLEKITCAIFAKEEKLVKLVGVGKKRFSSSEEVFDAVLEALDSLAAIVPDFPSTGLLGISGGSLETITTIARYKRPKVKKPISSKETEDILHKIVGDLNTNEKKIFFSTVAGAQIDGVRVSNPLGLKGEKVELSCFVAFKDSTEMELLDRLMDEIDLKIEKIMPASFAVAKALEPKNLEDALIFRVGVDKSEITALVDGHVSEILPVGLGSREPELLPLSWQAVLSKLEKNHHPDLIWLFADNDQVELPKLKEILIGFDWKSKSGFEVAPKIEVAESIQNFSPADIGVYGLSRQEIEE